MKATLDEEYRDAITKETRAQYCHYIKRGLQNGLSSFLGHATPTAFIYAPKLTTTGEFIVYDTTHLLDAHAESIREHYAQTNALQTIELVTSPNIPDWSPEIHPDLLCFASQTPSLWYHVLCIQNNRAVKSAALDIINSWAELAKLYFLHDPLRLSPYYLMAITKVLEHGAFDVIPHVIDKKLELLNSNQEQLSIILESLLAITTMKEEGEHCNGNIILLLKNNLLPENNHASQLIWSFTEPVDISNRKHIRKLFTAAREKFCLVADGTTIIGLAKLENLSTQNLVATCRDGKCTLSINGESICTMVNGQFRATSITAPIDVQEKSALVKNLPRDKSEQLQININRIVDSARTKKFGCSLLLDFGNPLAHNLTGQMLNNPIPLSEVNHELIEGLLHVDGAVHIDVNALEIKSFACLLDGNKAPGENLARGARYNSALRYSANSNVAVLTISEDGPITFFEDGKAEQEINPFVRDWQYDKKPPSLSQWLSARI